jgi:hypothetical protein
MIIIVICVCIVALVAGILGYKSLRQNHINQLLELGDQYLSDAQYEEAIASYKQVLAIEPKEETACENIVVAAVDWTDDLIKEKDFDKAKEVLEDVQNVVEDARLEKKITEVEMAQDAYEEQLEAEALITDTLNELAEICATEDADAVFTYMESDAYAEICASEYFEFDTKYETENGSLGLYEGGEYLYYGDYDGEQRSGQGAWYGYSPDEYAVGTWADDKPNGEQKLVRSMTYDDEPTIQTMEGFVVDGLWDGAVVESYDSREWIFTFTYENGVVDVIEMDDYDEEFPCVVAKIDSGNMRHTYQMTKEQVEKTYGIFGFADIF